MYKKRPGTSGVRGHLYETKLLSLLLFRAQHNDNIEEFYLGTNIDEIGAFDDICIKARVTGLDRPVAVFIQAKHRENDNKVVILNNKNNLTKYFESFLKIKQKFDIKSNDSIFNGKYDDTDCIFVLYTTEQGEFHDMFEGSAADIINDLIATGDYACRPGYNDEDVSLLCKIATREEIRMLAARFCKYIYQKNTDMNDELISRYHVILAKKVVEVSDIQPKGYRIATFRLTFFYSHGRSDLSLLRNYFFTEVLKRQATKCKDKVPDDETIQTLLTCFFTDPSAVNLANLIVDNIMTYKNGRLEFYSGIPLNTRHKLKHLNLTQSLIDDAITIAVKTLLEQPFHFQVPAAFGNNDLMLKNNKRLAHLTKKLLDLLNESSPNKIIMLDENNTDAGFLHLNGGLGSAVGNVLIYDENTMLYKFNDKIEWLEKYSKCLLEQLTNKISNLDEYRLDIKAKNFPKLSFDTGDKELVNEFFSKLIFFANQEDENGVGNILKQEIDTYEGSDAKNFRVKTDAIFLNFHEEIQKWWMKPNKAEYLTEKSELYQQAINNIVDNPIISVISMMYISEVSKIECTFTENPRVSFKSVELESRIIIVTDITKLTFIKVIQSMGIKEYVVLDLKYVINLPTSDFRALNMELKKISSGKRIIIVCDKLQNTSTFQRSLQEIARALNDKNIIIIINTQFKDSVTKHFPRCTLINDEGNSLSDLNQDSQINIIKNTNIIFQGQEMSLEAVVDDESVAFVKGEVLNKILLNQTIYLGAPLEFPKRPYELLGYDESRLQYEVNDLYIDRKVQPGLERTQKEQKNLQTLYDIDDDIVLITAKPGMGKTTLLSYLSIKTRVVDTKLWLMRINLLDHSKDFSQWKKNKTLIDILEVLKFLSQVILKQESKDANNMTISFAIGDNGSIYLRDSIDDEWITFELEMFLHFLKKGNLILLFDGFDEICPHYEHEVICFLNAIRSLPHKLKMWITSRPYNKIKTVLQQNFGITEPYELEPFSEIDQEIYFERFWKNNLSFDELSEVQLLNIKAFINFMVDRTQSVFSDNFIRIHKPQNFLLDNIYLHFMKYVDYQMKMLPTAFPKLWSHENTLDYTIRISKHSQTRFRLNLGQGSINNLFEFVGTPLHLYLVGNYFLSLIKDDTKKAKQWDLDVNTYGIYESFLESKLKYIRFQDKNNMDIDNPDVLETYEIVRKEFIDTHKKLAAYAMFQVNGHEIFDEEGLDEIMLFINKIQNGSEKTGLIYSVTNNIPQFIHMTFTEYFAVEYICDLLKSDKDSNKQKELCNFILNTMLYNMPHNILSIMDQKLNIDTEFKLALENNSDHIFNLLMIPDTKSPLCEVISKNLNNFLTIFMSLIESKINEDNLDVFINVIFQTRFLKIASTMRYRDLIINVMSVVRNVDVSKWRSIVSNPACYCENIVLNTDVRRAVRDHVLSYYIRQKRLNLSAPSNEEA